MEKFNLKEMIGGWFIGNFDPSVIKTDLFEVAVKYYKENTIEKKHYHKEAVEYTVIVKGTVKFNNIIYNEGDIVKIEKLEEVEFQSITDSITTVVKVPSIKGDKYFV